MFLWLESPNVLISFWKRNALRFLLSTLQLDLGTRGRCWYNDGARALQENVFICSEQHYEVCFLFDRSDEFTGDRKNVDWCHFEYLFFTWSLSFEGSLWSQSMIMTPCLWEEKVMRTLKMTTELCATLPWHFPWLTMLAWLLHELKLCLIMLNCTFSCMLIFTTLLRK